MENHMKGLLISVLLLLPIAASAGELFEDGRVAFTVGFDVAHDPSEPFAELRYIDTRTPFFHGTKYALGWSAFVGTKNTIGAEIFYPYEQWEFGLGIEYSDVVEDVVGTEGKYNLRIGYNITEQWSVQLLHKSNCSYVCERVPLMDVLPHGSEDKVNHGYNYLSLSYRY